MTADIEYLRKSEVKSFIKENLHSDIQKLLLNPPSAFKDHIKEIADQILARQKAKGKLDTWYSNPQLIFPPPLSVEQSSSEKTAEYKRSIFSGNQLIDLTGGMGVDCLTLSENFYNTTYVEQQPLLAETFQQNCRTLERDVNVMNTDAQSFVEQLASTDVSIFIDPARRDDAKNRVFKLEDCSPDISLLMPLLKNKAKQVLIKLSPLLDIKSVLATLKHVKEVHVVSVRNECKELLFLLDFAWSGVPKIKTINIESSGDQVYDFKFQEEETAIASFGEPSAFLFEPNASILKAGAFKKIAEEFGIAKCHPNTHLYTSNDPVPNWPGRTFEILTSEVDKKSLKAFAPDGYINVLTRNYPVDPKALKAKFKVKDGGEFFLIGFKGEKEKARLVVAKRV